MSYMCLYCKITKELGYSIEYAIEEYKLKRKIATAKNQYCDLNNYSYLLQLYQDINDNDCSCNTKSVKHIRKKIRRSYVANNRCGKNCGECTLCYEWYDREYYFKPYCVIYAFQVRIATVESLP